MSVSTRYARTQSSPFLASALRHADPFTAALGVYNHMYHLLHYGDPEAEYQALIERVVLWDVAVEKQLEISGPDAFKFVQRLVPRDLTTCAVGQCKYVFLTNEAGGIISDPILMRVEPNRFRLSLADSDAHLWCRGLAVNAGFDVTISLPDIAPVQIQGPRARDLMVDLFGSAVLDLGYYRLMSASYQDMRLEISRTGWSTELGYEVRIEAGILAYGCDLDEQTNPFEVDMGYKWMVDLDQPTDFVGKRALHRIRDEGPTRRMVGVDLSGESMGTFSDGRMPETMTVERDGAAVGVLTSACWSPRLEKNIGFAMVDIAHSELGAEYTVAHPELGTLDAGAGPKPHWDPERRTARS